MKIHISEMVVLYEETPPSPPNPPQLPPPLCLPPLSPCLSPFPLVMFIHPLHLATGALEGRLQPFYRVAVSHFAVSHLPFPTSRFPF